MVILKGVVGSHAYGYANASSDIDWMTVHVDPVEYYLGLDSIDKVRASQTTSEEEDETKYEFLHFIKLCVKFNPNVIPLLFLEDHEYNVVHSAVLRFLWDNHLFLSMKARTTLLGYAWGQKRQVEEGITKKKGEKRKKLIETFGYDVKAAGHTIRLLNLGIDLFATGKILLKNSSSLCLDIRKGNYTEDQFNELFLRTMDKFDETAEKATLPFEPDYDTLNRMCVRTMEQLLYQKENTYGL